MAWLLLLVAVAVLAALSARSVADAAVTAPAVAASGRCPFLGHLAAPTTIGGRDVRSFRPTADPAAGPDGSVTRCVSGHEPEVVIVVADLRTAIDAAAAPSGADVFTVGTVPHPTLQIDLERWSSATRIADDVRISDGRRLVSVSTVWTSVDPIDGAGPGRPDVDGAIALATAILDG